MTPGTPDLELFPYQKVGRDFLVQHEVAFLADQPGLGKTPQAICAARDWWRRANKLRAPHVCVICPRSAITNWRRELKRWWPQHDNPMDMVTNFEQIVTNATTRGVFEATPWDIIIIDEAHRLKTAGANRSTMIYRAIYQMRKKNPMMRVWLLSGTPAKNHTGELWTHLRTLRPDLIHDRSGRPMTQEQFEEHYCRVGFDKHGHRRINGSKNIRELRDKLFNEGFLLRRRKSEVQTDLPDLIFDDYPLSSEKAMLPPSFKNFSHKALRGLTGDEVLAFLETVSGTLAEWRHDVARVKVPLVKEYLETELDTPGEKIIVFFHHTILGRELYHLMGLYQPVIVDGGTKDPQAEVDTFQNDPNCRLFFGQISTCQEALNITAATQVAFAEAAWSPSDNYQAACRAHRFGMGENLLVRMLSLAGTPDAIIQRVLARKAVELTELFD